MSLRLLILLLFVSLQGRAVTRLVNYHLLKRETVAYKPGQSKHYQLKEFSCKLQCWTQRFTPISLDGTLPPEQSKLITNTAGTLIAGESPLSLHYRTTHPATLRGPPLS